MKSKLMLCSLLAATLLLTACANPGASLNTTPPYADSLDDVPFDSTPADSTTEAPTALNIITNNECNFTVIRGDLAGEYIVKAVIELGNAVKETTGVALKVSDDWVRPDEVIDQNKPEIIVGVCDRDAVKGLDDTLDTRSYTIRVVGNKLIILGKTEKLTYTAVKYFIENYLTADYASKGQLSLPLDLNVVQSVIKFDMTQLINSEDSYTTQQKKVFEVPARDGFRIMQGGCSDGKYLYMAMTNDNHAYIFKYDLNDYSEVACSKSLPLDHCNDICYNPDTGKLVVAHNAPNRTKISIVDPETLTVDESKTLPCQIFSIAYCSARQQYAVGLSGGQNFALLTSDFKMIKKYAVTSTGYTTQGMDCDEDFVYFVQYHQNVIMIYDWSGKLVKRVDMTLPGIEPENICLVGDIFYIGCNNAKWNGGDVYELKIIKQ